ncbi:PIG-L family deacetylase [Ramlibacter ginsenosidimutans]|uniref:PIG-L family deacetylase n=1 Tax=Ramlibacter ginsenosidimutans TaxID=502333 RepID=A0A934TPR0_9BURK|nr:PIG-L family deacetylase [Ramlibacter ginsenosidimutans]MBK6005213.1 PIG-L family deacetylase [Ramlibacter ginsenosidimutans]
MPSNPAADSRPCGSDEDCLVYARPHFRREGANLHFFLSSRIYRRLNEAEAAIWDALGAGPATIGELHDRAAVKEIAEDGLVEIVAPVAANDRRRILVVEPHCDDAALSIGATMWKLREQVEFHLLTMASRSNYSTAFQMHRDYFNRSRITEMRTAEGELFMAHLGGTYHCAGLAEATLRYKDSDWDLDFFNAHEVAAAISNNRRAPSRVLQEWTATLREFLQDRSFAEIWLPLGAGTHSDHDLARAAGLRVVMDQPAATVRLYEDVPYGVHYQEHTTRILKLLDTHGASLSPCPEDVTDEFPTKLSLLKIFASQFKLGAIQPGVERASAADGGRKVERLWTLDALPSELPEDQLWIGAPDVQKAATSLQTFRTGASSETRVAIFAINASGRWADDLVLVTDLFPRAKFVVYAGPRVFAEFEEVANPAVDLNRLDGHPASWLKAALREVGTGHRIVIAGEAGSKVKALKAFWQIGRTLTVPAMDNLFQALASS